MRALASHIQQARADLRLTVDEVADRCGLSPSMVWQILDGEAGQAPTVEQVWLDRLAGGLGCPPEALYAAAARDERAASGAPILAGA